MNSDHDDTDFQPHERSTPVGYRRVSTRGQLVNGRRHVENGNFPISKQYSQINRFADSVGLSVRKWFAEVGPSVDASPEERPALLAAVETAYLQDRPLIVTDISRITRDVEVIRTIMVELGVEIIDVSLGRHVLPDEAIRLVVRRHREHEKRKATAKDGVVRAKKAGKRFGNPNILAAQRRGCETRKQSARDFYQRILHTIEKLAAAPSMRRASKVNYARMARHLNDLQIETRLGRKWSSGTLKDVHAKAKGLR
jgi:DNA invertase Pin-like site-specific DNA recombinase